MRPSVLTVDDSKAVRLLTAKVLAPYACDAEEASNGFNAFFAIERRRPDLILLDLAMPVMDGVETLRRLKGTPELADIPVIMLASPADRPLLSELQVMGASGTIMKPFTEAELLAAIGNVIKLMPARP